MSTEQKLIREDFSLNPGAEPLLGKRTTIPTNNIKIYLSFAWRYFIRPLLVAGLCLMLAFAIFGSSFLFVTGGFLGEITPTISAICLGIALPLIANLVIHANKSDAVVDIPTCQTIAHVDEALQMIKRYPYVSLPVRLMFRRALHTHIVNAMQLLKNPWKENGLLQYGNNMDAEEDEDFQTLETAKNTLEEYLGKDDADEGESECLTVIANLEPIFERFQKVDPTYRPPLSKLSTIIFSFLSTALLACCVTLLAEIFIGNVVITEMAGFMVGAALCGFLSWVCAKYIISNNSGGAYAHWAVLCGATTVIFSVLWVFAQQGFSVGLPNATVIYAAVFPGIGFIGFIIAAVIYATRSKEQKTEHREGIVYPYVVKPLLWLAKFALLFSLLFLVFVCIAMLFNLQGLGIFTNLMDYATNIIIERAGIGGLEMGHQWLVAFAIATLSIASFCAFELMKHLLEKSPATKSDINKKGTLNQVARLFTIASKIIFSASLIIALYELSKTGTFIAGATTSLFPIFLIVTLVMPLFAGNVNLPDFSAHFGRWLNTKFGLKPFVDNQSHFAYVLKKEALIFLALGLLMFFSFLPSVPAENATILSVAISTTLLFRWGTMLWNYYHNPKALAKDYLEASHVKVTDIAEKLKKDVAAVQMVIDYFPKSPGHLQIRFKMLKQSRYSISGLSDCYEFRFNWGGTKASYVKPEPDNEVDDPSWISIETPITGITAHEHAEMRKKFENIHDGIRQNLLQNADPHTFYNKVYDLTKYNCAHTSWEIAKKYLIDVMGVKADKFTEPSMLPEATFQSLARTVLVYYKENASWLSTRRLQEILQADIDRLILKIKQAKAAGTEEMVVVLEELKKAKETEKSAITDATDEPPALEEKNSAALQPSASFLRSLSSPSTDWIHQAQHPLPRNMSSIRVPLDENALQPDPKPSILIMCIKRGGWFLLSVVILLLLVLMSTPTGQLFLGASSVTATLIFAGIFTLSTSYFFGKPNFWPSAMESTWALLARQGVEFELINKYTQNHKLSPAEQKSLLHFLNTAIQAMEHQILPDEKNNVRVVIWEDQQEAGASTLFKTDLLALKDFRNKVKDGKEWGPNQDNPITDICNRLKNCEFSKDKNGRTTRKLIMTSFALVLLSLAITAISFALDLNHANLTGAAMAGWIFGGLLVALLAIKLLLEWGREQPSSFIACVDRPQKGMPRMTLERLVFTVSNVALFCLAITACVVAEYAVSVPMVLISFAWFAGQVMTNKTVQKLSVKKLWQELRPEITLGKQVESDMTVGAVAVPAAQLAAASINGTAPAAEAVKDKKEEKLQRRGRRQQPRFPWQTTDQSDKGDPALAAVELNPSALASSLPSTNSILGNDS